MTCGRCLPDFGPVNCKDQHKPPSSRGSCLVGNPLLLGLWTLADGNLLQKLFVASLLPALQRNEQTPPC